MDSNKMSEKVVDFIEENLMDNLNLDTIANEMKYSKYHFHRLFLAEMGCSVVDYIRRRRVIRAAASLLNSNEKKVTTISYSYGFNNIDTFIRCFKKYYGVTPSEYRKINVESIILYKERLVI